MDKQTTPYSETWFHILLGAYVGAWGLVSGLTPKLVPLDLSWLGIGTLTFSYGVFIHAITFPSADIVTEVWGASRARLMVYIGVVMYCTSILFYVVGTKLPPAPGWELNDAYVSIFASAGRMILGSVIATIVAQLLDIFVFVRVKRMTGQRGLWIRNNASTMVAQFADAAIFYSVAFYGVIPTSEIPKLVFGTYLVKVFLSILGTPVVYLVVRRITGQWSVKVDVE
jgi:queuosine precursor transporter